MNGEATLADVTAVLPRADYDYAAQNPARYKLENLISAMGDPNYASLEAGMGKLGGEFIRHFAAYLNIGEVEAQSQLWRLMKGFQSAISETDWRLGYGKTRKDATIPEVAAHVVSEAAEMLEYAFNSSGVTAYRNRNHRFIEALASLADEAAGSKPANMTFYQRLGMQVSRHILDHHHIIDEPLLAPSSRVQAEIEEVAITQVVYFVQCGTDGPIKIGIAKDPKARLASLQTAHHDELHIRALCSGGLEQEKSYHERFAAHSLRGEWFEPHPDILAEIARLQPLCGSDV